MEAQQHVSETDYENRRASRRARTLRRATIILSGGHSTFECIIRNLSDTGAMLEVAGQLGIPPKFELATKAERHFHPCTVRWRAARSLGVSFDDVQPSTH